MLSLFFASSVASRSQESGKVKKKVLTVFSFSFFFSLLCRSERAGCIAIISIIIIMSLCCFNAKGGGGRRSKRRKCVLSGSVLGVAAAGDYSFSLRGLQI